MGITPAQQAALNRALPILKQRAIEHQHPNLKAIAEPPAPKGILLSQAIAEFNAARAIERKGKATVSRYRVVAEKLLIGDGSYLNIAFPDSVANLVVFTMTPGHVRFMYGFSFYRHGLQLFLS